MERHLSAYGDNPIYRDMLDVGGDYAFRLRGEEHAWTPESVSRLQHAVRGNNWSEYKSFADTINEQSERLLALRGLMRFKLAENPIPLDEVEPAVEIVKRFATGAMGFGLDLPRGAYQRWRLRMNRIGARSNTGEGGEEPERFKPLANGDSTRSSIKQVASGRFGVTTEYLVDSDDIQIKTAQGPSPARADNCPARKWTRTSPVCAIPRRASD